MECPICGSKLNSITGELKSIEFKKEKFNVYEKYFQCENCSEKFEDVESGDFNIFQIYNQYREKHKLLFPSEITELREKYGLTKIKMSQVLGWGENTYATYEKGAIQNESHNSLLKLIEDPNQFLKLIELRNDLFTKRELENLEAKITNIINEKKEQKWIDLVWPRRIGSDTGYVKPCLNKFINMVLFFASEEKEVYKTKLNKLLFYADFWHYKEYVCSISGARYRAIQYGPVPAEYDSLYDWMFKNNFIDIKENIEECGVTEKMVAVQKYNLDLFKESEKIMLNKVFETFKNFKPSDIRDYSHKEPLWKKNVDRKSIINYQIQ